MVRTIESVGEWFEGQVAIRAPIDPDAFMAACIELEVWALWDACEAFKALMARFEDDAIGATMRFLHVSNALHDGTLREFVLRTDEGQCIMPRAVFWTAAISPFHATRDEMDDRAWRVAIAQAISAE